jgi:uncharacterized protein GlcG (DUF336 family)
MRSFPLARLVAAISLLFGACGGGGDSGSGDSGPPGCDGSCTQEALTADEVRTVIAQAVAAAEIAGLPSTIAVVDRVGNVLAVFAMTGAPEETVVAGTEGEGLEGQSVPSALAAISKAGTGAYLSSQGNAFTTRTASQIVQQHFNPEELGQAGGPLFGVQFSQLPCGDLVTRFDSNEGTGPNRLPLGLSADPGGVPLYKPSSGPGGTGLVLVGGVGIEGNQTYLADAPPNFVEEEIALAASRGFQAPLDRVAERITVNGRALRFSQSNPVPIGETPAFGDLDGKLMTVDGFADDAVRAGVALSTPESGILLTSFEGIPAEILVGVPPNSEPRFPPRAATTPGGLTADEVRSILKNGQLIARRARAQIRRPLGIDVRVTVSVVGVDLEVLGVLRSPDAPVFGIDVSLQKARAAAFLSAPRAAEQLETAGFDSYVAATRATLGDPTAFTGRIAFANRSIGNLARPFFPDGIDGNPNGPLSKPIPEWSAFNTGLQLDIVKPGIFDVLGGGDPSECNMDLPGLANGIQIFPGSVPIYRGSTLIGAVGVSGDGIDQDDMVAFLGLNGAAQELGTISNAAPEIRADQIQVDGSHLRYVNCPVQPFIDSDQQEACSGL